MNQPAAPEAELRIELIWAQSARAWRLMLQLPAGSTVAVAMDELAKNAEGWPDAAMRPAGWAVFGREVSAETILRDGDRLELLRALPSDPKLARRARAEVTGQKGPKRR